MNLNENEQMENNTQKRKEYVAVKKSTIVLLLLLLLLLLAGVLLLFVTLQKDPDGVPLDPMSGKYEAPLEVPENTDGQYITIPGLSKIYLKEGSDTAGAALWNPDTNPCYFQYTIVLQETGEEVYESGLIEPGNAVTEVKFDRTFTKGVYPIIIRISSYDLVDYEQPLNGGEVDAELIVLVKEEEQ